MKKYRPSKGFIWCLFLLIFMVWLLPKYIPLKENEQNISISNKVGSEKPIIAEKSNSFTEEDIRRLPKVDQNKYTIQKWGGRFFIIPKEYHSSFGLHFYYPKDIQEMIRKNPHGDFRNNKDIQNGGVSIYIGSPQQAALGGRFSDITNEPCIEHMGRFKWNGLYIILDGKPMGVGIPNKEELFAKQRKEICSIALNLLNTQMKEIYYVN
ncbi:hypothetical protein [Acinetobacter sp. S54]|uniref:hypothetical protein n=1 Tax=Acinetobacter sp. S54 TaxID=2767435 RepID=UPI00190B16F9|nr:hypothetical protein [Acinetobacter sp. S54]MBK0067947.1 hypothetical protein [Acinetobacter sp. S54]